MSIANSNGTKHTWRFFRAGGFDQVRLDSGSDIAALDQLDQKLWVALASPTKGLEFDAKTLELIDTDKDGRIRAPEILAAAKWACAMLKDPEELIKGAAALPLAAINDADPEGKQLLSSAKQILINLGKGDAATIDLDDTTDTVKIFTQTKFNGDGIVPVESADDPAVQAVITDIIACLGSQPDRSGKPGITQDNLDVFFKELAAYSDWWAKAEADAANVLPHGAGTTATAAALNAIKPKIDDYFARCRLAAYDPRALTALNRDEKEYLPIASHDMTIAATEVAAFPLAQVAADKPLSLNAGINPAWADTMAAFKDAVVTPLLGKVDLLTEAQWSTIRAKFAAYDAWAAAKAGAVVEKLTLPRVREILAGNSKETINALIAKDKALEPESNAISGVDRLVRYHRDLHRLLNNYVSFREFYRRREKAVFQVGTLYLDSRSCDLCVRVDDAAKHSLMAHLSYTYLAYCDLTRKSTGEKMTIAAGFTAGDSDNLMVGRNGIFYDRKGQDWDATITKIVDNPISIHQAFFAPYKRLLRWIEEQVAKRAAAADAAASNKLTAAVTPLADGTPPAAPPPAPKVDVGALAAMAVAFGLVSAALGAMLQAFFGLGAWMPLGVVGLILVISGPSMIIAWLKLRQRNLGPILDANGWAINAKAKINIPFGGSLTRMPKLPPGSHRDLADPYAESHKGRNRLIALAIFLLILAGLWFFGAVEYVRPGLLPASNFVVRMQAKKADQLLAEGRTALQNNNLEAADKAFTQLQDLQPELTILKLDSVYNSKIDDLGIKIKAVADAKAIKQLIEKENAAPTSAPTK